MTECPEWEYSHHPKRGPVLQAELVQIMLGLRKGQIDSKAGSSDTRQLHRRLFSNLTPEGFEYYAGHYRGEDFPCLKHCEVGIQGDQRVGWPAAEVLLAMGRLGLSVQNAISKLDSTLDLPKSTLSPEDRLLYAVAATCSIFEHFLCIHPYLNGNGHIGRLLIWLILGRYGYWPLKFPIDPRPPDPPYTDLVVRCRNGDHGPLEKYILRCLAD